MVFSNGVLCQTTSFRLGFAFINKRFHISNQWLLSEEAIPSPSSFSDSPAFPPCPSQQAWDRQEMTGNSGSIMCCQCWVCPHPQGANHAPEHVRHSTRIGVSGNRVPESLPVAPDNCSDSNGLSCINSIFVLDSLVDDSGGEHIPTHPVAILPRHTYLR